LSFFLCRVPSPVLALISTPWVLSSPIKKRCLRRILFNALRRGKERLQLRGRSITAVLERPRLLSLGAVNASRVGCDLCQPRPVVFFFLPDGTKKSPPRSIGG
jgi:hypothetical protein